VGNSNVVAFPLHRRKKLVSGIARVLESKHGDDANGFWRETAKEILRQLFASGLTVETAEEEVRTLLYAVLAEIHSRSEAVSG
jgi:hypothetical protein